MTEAAVRSSRLGQAPGALPLVGNAIQLFRDPLTFLPSLREEGDIVTVRIGRDTAYMATTHSAIQEVLHNPRVFDKGGEFIEKMQVILGDGVGTCSAANHKRQRRNIQPAFTKERLVKYAAIMRDEVADLVERWEPGQLIDVGTEMSTLTTRVTARALFSADIASDVIAEIQRSFPEVWKGVYRRMVIPFSLLHRIPTPANRNFHRALRRLDAVLVKMLAAYRADQRDRDDILSTLLAARDEESGNGLTDQEIFDELHTVLAAGVETPASGLTWSFYLLGQNPDIERKLLQEVDSVSCGRLAESEDVADMPYLQGVVAEALRLYPPVWYLTRRTTIDTTLAGHPIPAGTSVMFSPYALHRDPNLFTDPERFDPERWLPGDGKPPKASDITFGGGTRKCLGDVLAGRELAIALASILGRWRLRPVPGHTLRPSAKAELTTGPLPMTIKPRP
ncbi:cytochrome P450 [Streptomyces sp. NPDC001928]|uniref:cytochrome P450 n=1 Tax=Streptomyces sp. NPDC001928 TaxID=3154404 RepID=UPI003316C161